MTLFGLVFSMYMPRLGKSDIAVPLGFAPMKLPSKTFPPFVVT